ncbi:UDP-N-acetylmuramoyl-L-alanine--D-glutamate ligase [Candidatus Colwellia aromaticivorans]|uniref:UDP-N-acetylmuramoyl-L-alanine--D-glutamate ligase n=1 Tax=Candidatus Colwellia aromaticivorans TaxID=2267621 RepID=UPI000DF2D2C7|nr:UDP-N-acetylmuramoyl-L-alanine--D-glutamate ligase [Candidatus Colwellia aromaticivorans]
MTLLADFKDKQILVLGAGITGMSCVRYLSAQGLCFAVNDSRTQPFAGDYNERQFSEEFPRASLHLGQWRSELIANADIILISPGIDSAIVEIAQHISADCRVMGDVELFCLLNNERFNQPDVNPIQILAVTGSNGKSTVVSLLAHLADSLGVNAQLGGNIGQPVLDIFTKETTGENTDIPAMLILELSSFQLETLTSMQAIATSVLNVSDDHLDRHQSMENYQGIKQSIYPQGKLAIINRDDEATKALNEFQPVISFGSDAPAQNQFGVTRVNGKAMLAFAEQNLITLDELPLAGMHNALNYLAVLALGYSAGWSLTAMVKNLAGFTGLAHRCQKIVSDDGITWINDSKATNIGATIAAINGLAQTLTSQDGVKQKLILIAGGDGKGADFTPLTEPLTMHVSQVITLGKDGDKIAELVQSANKVTSLFTAVQTAKSVAKTGDIVLLSPACASLDMFKNFGDRGEQFIAAVAKVTEAS